MISQYPQRFHQCNACALVDDRNIPKNFKKCNWFFFFMLAIFESFFFVLMFFFFFIRERTGRKETHNYFFRDKTTIFENITFLTSFRYLQRLRKKQNKVFFFLKHPYGYILILKVMFFFSFHCLI